MQICNATTTQQTILGITTTNTMQSCDGSSTQAIQLDPIIYQGIWWGAILIQALFVIGSAYAFYKAVTHEHE